MGMGRSVVSLTIQTSSPGDRVCFAGDRASLVTLQALFPQLQGGRTLGPLEISWSRAGLPELGSEHLLKRHQMDLMDEETTDGQGSVQPSEAPPA